MWTEHGEQGCCSLPRWPTPGPASQGQHEPDLCVFMGFHQLGGLTDFRQHPSLYDLPLACNPDMLPVPQSPTLRPCGWSVSPCGGKGLGNGLPVECLLCLESYLKDVGPSSFSGIKVRLGSVGRT